MILINSIYIWSAIFIKSISISSEMLKTPSIIKSTLTLNANDSKLSIYFHGFLQTAVPMPSIAVFFKFLAFKSKTWRNNQSISWTMHLFNCWRGFLSLKIHEPFVPLTRSYFTDFSRIWNVWNIRKYSRWLLFKKRIRYFYCTRHRCAILKFDLL